MKSNTAGRFVQYAALAVAGVALLYTALRLGLNYSGFCLEERRFLTDQEKIDNVVRRILNSYPPALKSYITTADGQKAIRWARPNNPIPYASIGDFLAVNPDCCAVTLQEHPQSGGQISLMDRLLGFTSANVRVRYQVRYRDENDQLKTEYVEPYWAVTSCGRPH
jgi:hypothetical protein